MIAGRVPDDVEGRLGSDQLRHSAQTLLRHLHARLAPDVERGSLVELGGRDVEHPLEAVARGAPRLLHDEAEWIRLVKEAELSLRRLAIRRIREDAAAEQIPVEVRDEGTDVAHAQRLRG